MHSGLEIEVYGDIARGLRLDAMLSAGNWTYKDDVELQFFDDDQNFVGDSTLLLKDAKVGDAAQFTTRLGLTWEIVNGLRIYASWYLADNLYADYNVTRDKNFFDPTLTPEQRVLKLPSYSLVDAGLYYDFAVGGTNWTFRLNVNNLLDKQYWSESETNRTDEADFNKNIAYPGFGTTWNTGLAIKF